MFFYAKMKFDYFRIKELHRILNHWEDVKKINSERDLKLVAVHFKGYQADDFKITAINKINDIEWLKACQDKEIQLVSDTPGCLEGAIIVRIKTLIRPNLYLVA